MRLHLIGKGMVGHYVADGATLCQRDASVTSPVVTGTRVCKPCAVVAEKRASATTQTVPPMTYAEIMTRAESRKTDHTRIVGRMRADVATETASVGRPEITRYTRGYAPATKIGGALSDRASMVAPLSVRPIGGTDVFRFPFTHEYNAATSTVWAYVADTMGDAFTKRVTARLAKDVSHFVFQILASEIDDMATVVRIRAFGKLMTLMTSDDVIRHGADHVCDTCTRSGSVGDASSPFGVRTHTFASVPMADGTIAFTYDRPARCGECEWCSVSTGHVFLIGGCESPVTAVDHVSAGAVIGRAVRAGVADYRSASKRRRTDAAGDASEAFALRPGDTEDVDVMGVSSNVPTDVAEIMSVVCAGLMVAGADATGGNGKATDDALIMLAMCTGNVTRTEHGIVASPNQRRTAVEKVRAMWADVTNMRDITAPEDYFPMCQCRWSVTTGTRFRTCNGHGGTRAINLAMSDAVGTRYATNNRARSGHGNITLDTPNVSAGVCPTCAVTDCTHVASLVPTVPVVPVATSPVAGRTITADDLADAVYPLD